MPLLELTELSVAYGPVRAVTDVTITIAQGEIVTLIGANGAGKSTILRTVSRLVAQCSGRMAFDGRDITRLSQRALSMGAAPAQRTR